MSYLKQICMAALAMAVVGACSKDNPGADTRSDAIELSAGIGMDKPLTKVLANPDANHSKHYAFKSGTKASVRMYGRWTGDDVIKYTTATIGGETSTEPHSFHNSVSTNPLHFWDDFGSADEENTAGIARGLDIFGVAVDNVPTAPVVANDAAWSSFEWNLDVNQSGGWNLKDLLTSNNIKYSTTESLDNAYKFKNRDAGKLMEFTHAMSKVTIRLTAGEGFPIVNTEHCFENAPEVTLIGFKYKGHVNIINKLSTPSGETANITPKNTAGGAGHTAEYDALVYPGNKFANATDIIKIKADGNFYYVSASSINAANTADDDVFEDGKNYIIKVTLHKTDMNITATISGWDEVEAEEVAPEINIHGDWGAAGTTVGSGFASFSFYRSTSLANGYSTGIDLVNGYIPAEAIAVKDLEHPEAKWPFQTLDVSPLATKLFWPSHDTHYQFRGVWPLTSTEAGATSASPRVQTVNSEDVIAVKNVAYTAGSFPSDLMIGRPEFVDGEGNLTDPECTNPDHSHQHLYSQGICATTGLVDLNFRYMMSQVEVVLGSSASDSPDFVSVGSNTVVELINVKNSGNVKLGDRSVATTGDAGSYTLNATTDPLKRHSAIVPQTLTYSTPGADTNLRFKITVTNSDDSKDIYFADVYPIKKSGSENRVAPNDEWESGMHYKYTLTLKKTEISVTASVTDWKVAQAEEDIWF